MESLAGDREEIRDRLVHYAARIHELELLSVPRVREDLHLVNPVRGPVLILWRVSELVGKLITSSRMASEETKFKHLLKNLIAIREELRDNEFLLRHDGIPFENYSCLVITTIRTSVSKRKRTPFSCFTGVSR